VAGISGRRQLPRAVRGYAVRHRARLAATCASLVLAMLGVAFAPTSAHAALACSFDASGSPIGTTLTGDMTKSPLVSCYFGFAPGNDFGFTGFSTLNNLDFSGNVTVSSPPAVGFAFPSPNNAQSKLTTLVSSDGHAKIAFNAPTTANVDFDQYQFTVVSTDGSSTAVFNFFCNGTNNDGVNFPINTPCTLTLQLPAPAAPTATVAANPTTIPDGGTSTLTFT
jgi:hypothetical protein